MVGDFYLESVWQLGKTFLCLLNIYHQHLTKIKMLSTLTSLSPAAGKKIGQQVSERGKLNLKIDSRISQNDVNVKVVLN